MLWLLINPLITKIINTFFQDKTCSGNAQIKDTQFLEPSLVLISTLIAIKFMFSVRNPTLLVIDTAAVGAHHFVTVVGGRNIEKH